MCWIHITAAQSTTRSTAWMTHLTLTREKPHKISALNTMPSSRSTCPTSSNAQSSTLSSRSQNLTLQRELLHPVAKQPRSPPRSAVGKVYLQEIYLGNLERQRHVQMRGLNHSTSKSRRCTLLQALIINRSCGQLNT